VATFGRRALAGLIGPEIKFDLTDDITRILESRSATFHQAADMIAMQVGQRDQRDVVGRIAGSLEPLAKLAAAAGATAFTKAGVDEDDIRYGIDQRRGIAINEFIGRQEILRKQLLDRFRLLIGPEGFIRLFGNRGAVLEDSKLIRAELELIELGLRRRIHLGLFSTCGHCGRLSQNHRRRQQADARSKQSAPFHPRRYCHIQSFQ